MAEAFFNALSHTAKATSAGVDLKNSVMKDDLSVPPLVIDVMKEVDIDVSGARRKTVIPTMVQEADAVILLLGKNEYPLPTFVTESPKCIYWEGIPDAKGTDLSFHRTVRDMIRDRIVVLLNQKADSR
ncbi:hypothetical protein K2X83_00585 [Patescibacteria group bacterium]|nr:hypothetical protein [Patescibacteria group bacterium]